MIGLLVNWLLDALVVFCVASVVPGVKLKSYGTALVVSAVFALVTVLLGWLLTLLASILTLPAILLTFGLFFFVVRFAVNCFLLWMTAQMVDGFSVSGLVPLMLSAALISLGQSVVAAFR